MKLLQRSLFPLVALLVLGLSSCNEEIDFAGSASEAPVLYCLLDQADSIHYVKLTRAFAGNNNAVEVAQIADSNYYNDVSIKVEQWAGSDKLDEWTLSDTVITGKDPGAFYNPDQKVYYFKEKNLKYDSLIVTPNGSKNVVLTYKLIATVNDGDGFTVTAETNLVNGGAITSPSYLGAYNFVSVNNGSTNYLQQLIRVNPGTAEIVETRLQVYFDEYFAGVPVEKSFTWKLGNMTSESFTSLGASFKANGETFYNLIKQNATNDPTITKRVLKKIRLYATCGTNDLSKYIIVNQPSSSIAQNKPTFTNLSTSDGRPVIGIFSARNTVFQEKVNYVPTAPSIRGLDKNSMRELCTGPITFNLLFCSEHITDQAESWYCF
jgi:hypothetical protein